jgi:hypothetical protein
MKVIATSMPGGDSAMAAVEDEPDPLRWKLLNRYLADCERNEDLYLSALDRAESGTPELNWGDHHAWTSMYPDGRVVIEEMKPLNAEQNADQPLLPQIVITIAEARKLILDWIAARDKWHAEREAQQAATGPSK